MNRHACHFRNGRASLRTQPVQTGVLDIWAQTRSAWYWRISPFASFTAARILFFKDLNCAAVDVSAEPPDKLADDLFIQHLVHQPGSFIEAMPEHNSVKFKPHAASYDGDSHETISVLKAHASKFSSVRMFTKLYLVMSVCVKSAWDKLALWVMVEETVF